MSKYKNTKIRRENMTFDSKQEYERWVQLRLMEKAGDIWDLRRQVKHEIIPAQREVLPNGKTGAIVERNVVYKSDFEYRKRNPITGSVETVVEDVKGYKTREYIIKRKLMLYLHGIRIVEV